MKLLDAVESSSLQIQFAAIKSLPNQTTPDWMDPSLDVVRAINTVLHDSYNFVIRTERAKAPWRSRSRLPWKQGKFVSNHWIKTKEQLHNYFMKMHSQLTWAMKTTNIFPLLCSQHLWNTAKMQKSVFWQVPSLKWSSCWTSALACGLNQRWSPRPNGGSRQTGASGRFHEPRTICSHRVLKSQQWEL